MAANSSASGKNMKMIGAAVVVIIIVAIGAVLLMGGKGGAPNATTTVGSGMNPTTASTAPTTIAQQSAAASLAGWVGKNISLTQFRSDMNNFTFTKASMLNATYNYKIGIVLTGGYNYSENITGTTSIQKYYNSTRIETIIDTALGPSSSTIIYNTSSGKQYVCTSSPINSSVSCTVSNKAISIVNSTGLMGYVGSNMTLTGYFNNIRVSSASYNGQPCTLVTGDLYIKAQHAEQPSQFSVIQGTTGACISAQYNTWLNQSLVGTIAINSNGNTTNANINYLDQEISIGASSTAAITALPGPVVQS